MDRTPIEIADVVVANFRDEILSQQMLMKTPGVAALTSGDTSHFPIIKGDGIEDSDIEVRTHFSIQTCKHLGTFAASEILMASVWVNGVRRSTGLNTNVPTREAEGWSRARLGGAWSDYAYQVVTLREQIQRWPHLFVAIVTVSGQPTLAPENFLWGETGVGSPARPRKLAPSSANVSLLDWLKKHGDTVDYRYPLS